MDIYTQSVRTKDAWNRGDYGEYAKREVEFGFLQIREANVGKKRIVIELSEHEPPKHSIELLSKDAVKAGEDLSRCCEMPPRPTGGVVPSVDRHVHVDAVIPCELKESFDKLARSIDEWDKRGASS